MAIDEGSGILGLSTSCEMISLQVRVNLELSSHCGRGHANEGPGPASPELLTRTRISIGLL
jgi:hypothetical protein